MLVRSAGRTMGLFPVYVHTLILIHMGIQRNVTQILANVQYYLYI